MTEIRVPLTLPLFPQERGMGHFGYLDIGLLGFIWNLRLGDWDLTYVRSILFFFEFLNLLIQPFLLIWLGIQFQSPFVKLYGLFNPV